MQGQGQMIQGQLSLGALIRDAIMTAIFHLAFNVTDLDEARKFYGQLLGCSEGRSTESWFDFVIPPTMRFVGEPGEQGTMFFCDPSGNPIEVKTFSDMGQVFAS